MKQINIIITLLVVCLFSSCQKDNFHNSSNSEKAVLSIKLDILDNDIISKSVSSDDDENVLSNAYVFIFNSAGSKVYSKFYTEINSSKMLSINAIKQILGGKNMTVAVIVNIDNSIMNTTTTTLDAIINMQGLQDCVSTITGDYVERGNAFLMSGLKDVSLTEEINNIDVPLYRIDSKIRFNIKTPDNVTFSPSEWRVVSLPKKVSVLLLPNSLKDQFSHDPLNYFTTKWKNYEFVSPELGEKGVKATFAFYSIESMLDAKGIIPTEGTDYERYVLRDKQIKNEDGTNKPEFKYANDAGTYVEIKGNIKYEENSAAEASADVKFMIHLGGGVDDVNNYSTVRNTNYTYTVTINSADEILTEVVNNNEVRPGAEGDIVFADVIKEFDAYNSVFTISFKPGNVDHTLTWDVSTPFSKGEAESKPKDCEWVYFRRADMESTGSYIDGFKTYLGDEEVYPDVISSDMEASDFLDKYFSEIGTPTEKMLNVDQLVEILKESKRRKDGNAGKQTLFDGTLNAVFTTFVQDYYYEFNPENASETAENGLWKKFANADKRVLNILSEYQVSADGNSTKSAAQYSIRQASIQTMYSTETTENITSFGSQFYPNEAADREFTKTGETTAVNDKSNGRKNYAGFFSVGSRWDTYIDVSTWKLKTEYDYAKYKSLLHNRDINGNGIINLEEIQWYLASIDQLFVLWIGEEALHPTSKLYSSPTWDLTKQHYVSSSVLETSNPEVLWAAEGSSVGKLNSASVRELLYYRTVRNLGIPKGASVDSKPDDVYTYVYPYAKQEKKYSSGNWSNTYVIHGYIDLSRMNSKALRDFYTETELPDHGLRDERGYNKPFKKFDINYNTAGSALTWEDVRARSQSDAVDPIVPDGWRVPNQRELSLMYIAMKNVEIDRGGSWPVYKRDYLQAWPLGDHFSRTGFNLNWATDRPGFSVGGVLYMLSNPGGSGGVRYVRDVR